MVHLQASFLCQCLFLCASKASKLSDVCVLLPLKLSVDQSSRPCDLKRQHMETSFLQQLSVLELLERH